MTTRTKKTKKTKKTMKKKNTSVVGREGDAGIPLDFMICVTECPIPSRRFCEGETLDVGSSHGHL